MNKEQMMLLKLVEECQEVSHKAAKAIKFGLLEKQPDQDKDNRQRLQEELIDLAVVVDLLIEMGIIDEDFMQDSERAKQVRAKIEKYNEYSASLGILKTN